MAERKNSYPVLKVPLDLSNPVDAEVYDIFHGMHSGVEAKNFLMSAVLYYSRSPLVLSVGNFVSAVEKAEGLFGEVLRRLDNFTQTCNAVPYSVENKVSDSVGGAGVAIDASVRSELVSLKEKFKL